jgi:putative endopeptidase
MNSLSFCERASFQALFLFFATFGYACANYLLPSAADLARPDVVAGNVDRSIDPGIDFFQYANGAWLKLHPIPSTRSAWGVGDVVRDELYERLRKICELAEAKSSMADDDERRVANFWRSGIDERLADKEGVLPLKMFLERIDDAKDVTDVVDVAFELRRISVNVFFDLQVWQDERASDVMAIHLSQDGLGLPDRDYYFRTDEDAAKIRVAYRTHLRNVLRLLGAKDATAGARHVMDFESALAKASRELADRRDPIKNYNRITLVELTQKFTASIDWKESFKKWGVSPTYVIVGQPDFFSGLETLLRQTSMATLRDYLRAHLVDRFSPFLSKEFDTEHFAFYGRVLSGQKKQEPRWKRVLDSENDAIGMILGRLFVRDYFNDAARQRYGNMVEAVRVAFGERIDRLGWMSEATKTKAREKLAAITKKVGFPEKWKDYSSLKIAGNSYADSVIAASSWRFDERLSKVGQPADREEWFMTPQSYDAYYYEGNNEIVLPAAIFTIPGFTETQLDDAVVYGYAAASTIGHEMTHGFDDEGRQFDAAGILTDWWTKEDAEKFQKRADVMVKQFDSYEPLPGLHINGRASLGENIADFGGLLTGLDAFKKTDQYKKGEKIAGYTPLQRFFLGYALGWLAQSTDPSLRRALLSDVHAPAKWRVNGPLSNMPDFWEAFDVKPGQPMRRREEERVEIW